MLRSNETVHRLTSHRDKSLLWLKRRTKRCTQLCYKTKCLALITPSYSMKCIMVTKIVMMILFIHRCKGKHTLRSQIRVLREPGETLICVPLQMCITHHHSILNSLYSSSITLLLWSRNTVAVLLLMIPKCLGAYSQTHQIAAITTSMMSLLISHRHQWVNLWTNQRIQGLWVSQMAPSIISSLASTKKPS